MKNKLEQNFLDKIYDKETISRPMTPGYWIGKPEQEP